MTSAQHTAVRSQAFDAIIELHAVTRRVIQCMDTDFETLFERPVARLKAASAMSGLRSQLDEFLRAVHGAFVGREIALVLAHGDCKIANFLHDGSFNIRGLVDWDRAQIDGLPVVDWVHYCAFDDMLAGRGPIAETILYCAQELEFDGNLAEYRSRFLVEGFRWRATAAMTLILHVVEQLDAGNQLAVAEMHAMPGVVARLLDWALAISPKG
jgi:aminoglycoside phosphotransferase (APT) family kinase protein